MKLAALALLLAACSRPAAPPSCPGVVLHLAKVLNAEPTPAFIESHTKDCTDGPWVLAHKRCVLEATNQKEIDACVLPKAPAPRPTPEVAPSPAPAPKKPRGADCIADHECAATMTCVRWTTESGDPHATCEVPC
ncbi:MAG: hypothetical protein H0V17_03325, partial [Deltaproteobacteria bacterium]|nr:hypothetical protein [Deltaproteobacteria bacterium]